MAGKLESERARADSEALNWIVWLREQPQDIVLRERFTRWLDASAENAAAWAETTRIYTGIGTTAPVHAERWRKLPGRRQVSPDALPMAPARENWRRRLLPIAGVAVAATLAVLILPSAMLHWRADAVTGTGEVRQIQLADGSVASLGPKSAIRIDRAEGGRHVTLLRGEAWFDVRHDPAHPFYVTAGSVQATDIGTAFDVRFNQAGARIAVERGAVRVDRAAPSLTQEITAGQTITIAADDAVVRGTETPGLVAAWRQGQLAVEVRSMRDVIDALRPWYGGVIAVTSDALIERKVTGVYDLRDPPGALAALAKAYGGHVRRVTPWLLVLSES